MDDRTIIILAIVAILVLLPVLATVISMCSYLGKVLAIRLMFKGKNDKGGNSHGKEKR